jgi:DNA/RNA-binding domain of Phe-tRNA-synthetase-like protein
VSDSVSTKVTNQTKRILLLVYGLEEFTEENMLEATEFTAGRIIHYNSGRIAEIGIRYRSKQQRQQNERL